jgi:hypothetical protein
MPITQSIESQIRDSIVALLSADSDVSGHYTTIVAGDAIMSRRGEEPWIQSPQIVVRNVPQRDTLRRMIGGDLSRDSVFIAVFTYDPPEEGTIPIGQVIAMDYALQLVLPALERGSLGGTKGEVGRLLQVDGDPANPLHWLTEKRPVVRKEDGVRIVNPNNREAIADSFAFLLEYHVRRTTTTKTRF